MCIRDRVVGVLEEVGAGLPREAIAHRTMLAAVLQTAAAMGRMDYGVEMDGA